MNRVDKIIFREIKRISPSQFYSMKNCSYKSLLAEAIEKRPLLPISPNAYYGIVLHKILELISKGMIKNEGDFQSLFEEQVKLQENLLAVQGYGFFVPLQKNVKDFGMKKVLLKKHMKRAIETVLPVKSIKFDSEKWFESADKLIAGKVDLIIDRDHAVEIVDFKTGNITQDVLDDSGELFSEIKDEYKGQLKLYAYLYFEATGRFPNRLSLVDLAKQKFSVEFSRHECETLFDEAKELLKKTKASLLHGRFSANPSVENCKYCLYRPACSFFLRQIETDYSFNDISGSVKNVVRYLNGNVSVFLESGPRQLTVTSFPSETFGELNDSRSKQISIYNLRKEGIEFVYSATKTTMIYENN